MGFAFWKGFAIGFWIAAAVGPIGVLCIRRSLEQGARIGFFTGLGAAAADGIYGAVAAFGLTIVSSFVEERVGILRAVGGIFLVYLGLKTFFSKPALQPATPVSHAGAFASTFFLTLTNPMTIISFLGVFASFGFTAATGGYLNATLATVGVVLGSTMWWIILSNAVARLRSRVTTIWMQRVNWLSGAVIFAFGAKTLAGLMVP